MTPGEVIVNFGSLYDSTQIGQYGWIDTKTCFSFP